MVRTEIEKDITQGNINTAYRKIKQNWLKRTGLRVNIILMLYKLYLNIFSICGQLPLKYLLFFLSIFSNHIVTYIRNSNNLIIKCL